MTAHVTSSALRTRGGKPAHSVAAASGDTFSEPVELFVGTAGTVTVTTEAGDTGIAYKVPAGATLPVRIKAITGVSGAADMVAYW